MFLSPTVKSSLSILGLAFLYQEGWAHTTPFPVIDTPVGTAVANTPKAKCFRLTDALNGQAGAVWFQNRVPIDQDFEVEACVYVGNKDASGADGLAFVLQTRGMTVGGAGEGKGYFTIPNTFAVELDTWQNHNQISDMVQITHTGPLGAANTAALNVLAAKDIPNIEHGREILFTVAWNQTTEIMTVDLCDKVNWHRICRKITHNIPGGLPQYLGGSTTAFYGYTAATGGANNVHYVCPIPPYSHQACCAGDPHFKTWAGEKYDFHGVCDLVFLQNPDFAGGVGLNIQIRTKKTRMWSFIHTAAVQIGDDILEVMGGADENRFWVNKVRGQLSDEAVTISGYSVTFEQLSPKSRKFVIDLENGEAIELKTWNGMVSINIKGVNSASFGNSLGLVGTFPEGLKVGRNNSTVIEDLNAFGQEWQVLSSEENLFHDVDGPQHPQKCDIPSTKKMRRRLGESVISLEEATLACSRVSSEDFDLCVFDVMATNDKDSVGAY